jgi:DNA-binding transcriptional MocR family regulator
MTLPDIQLFIRPGIVEFGWGHPNPAVLPTALMAEAAALTLTRDGRDALAYGAEQGPGRLIEHVRTELSADATPPPAEAVMITGGISQALDMLCAQLSQPGDVVLVEAPTYHLAMRIFRDRGLRLVQIPSDAQGMHVEAAEAMLAMLRGRGERVAFLYVVANFGNPTGNSLALARREALARMAQAQNLPVIEDDAYGLLWYDGPPPPSIYSLAPGGPIVRVGSFAKILAPGLRLGWMCADPALVQRCALSGLLDSGGGVNHFTAHVVASLIELGHLKTHIEQLRATLRARRDTLLEALARYLPADCTWNAPLGGFFIWIRLPAHMNAAALLSVAEQAGVSYLPGARFFAEEGGERYLRLSFSLLPPAELTEGARRLGSVLKQYS